MQDFLIQQIKQELRTDSRQLAQHLDHRHRTILESLDKYTEQFQALGRIPFETEKGLPLPQGGFAKPTRYAMLNEDQCYFLLTLMRNNDKVVGAKLRLVKAFRDARNALAMQQAARLETKQVRKLETAAIADMVEYAKGQGSQSPDKYYQAITKMTNAALGIDAGQRDNLDHRKLQQLRIAETIVEIAIRDGIAADMPYKDIFQLCKARVMSISQQLLQ